MEDIIPLAGSTSPNSEKSLKHKLRRKRMLETRFTKNFFHLLENISSTVKVHSRRRGKTKEGSMIMSNSMTQESKRNRIQTQNMQQNATRTLLLKLFSKLFTEIKAAFKN